MVYNHHYNTSNNTTQRRAHYFNLCLQIVSTALCCIVRGIVMMFVHRCKIENFYLEKPLQDTLSSCIQLKHLHVQITIRCKKSPTLSLV